MECTSIPSVLYFVCPTDGLETVINRSFRSENYYYTSLGNSVVFDEDTIYQIKRLLLKYSIKKISFVLSKMNPIINDALENQAFADIRGLNDFYKEVLIQKEHSEVLCSAHNRQFTILSYYLNKKIQELQLVLDEFDVDRPKIVGNVYDKQKNGFSQIYPDLVCTEYFRLN